MQTTQDAVRAQMRDAEAILQQLDPTLETIRFDPTDPASVTSAIKQTTEVIDSLLAQFRGNPVLAPLADQLKIQYLENIEDKVAASQRIRPRPTNPLSRAWRFFLAGGKGL